MYVFAFPTNLVFALFLRLPVQLIDLLKSEDKQVVSIACYDLGEFVRFYPSGKTIVKTLG